MFIVLRGTTFICTLTIINQKLLKCVKAGVHLNRSEICSNIQRKLLGLKWIGNTTRQSSPHPPKKEESPRLIEDCFGVHVLILHLKFQFYKSIKTSTIYFPQFNLSFDKKNISFPKRPKIYTKPPNSGYDYGDLVLLETWPRYWQKGRVKPRQNSLHVYPRNFKIFSFIVRHRGQKRKKW